MCAPSQKNKFLPSLHSLRTISLPRYFLPLWFLCFKEFSMESIQLLNTAIIKSKEKKVNQSFEERLNQVCNSPVIEILNKTITQYAETQKISRDQAALQVVEAIRELDSIWSDYVVMEGIDRLKNLLRNTH